MAKTLDEVAASLEEVLRVLSGLRKDSIEESQELAKANRSMGNALLVRMYQDLATEVRQLARAHPCPCQYVTACEETVKSLGKRLDLAGVKVKEMQNDLDLLKGSK